MPQDNDFQRRKVAVFDIIMRIHEAFSLCIHFAQSDVVFSFFTTEFHLRDKLTALRTLFVALNEDATLELLNALSDVADWIACYNMVIVELNRAVVNANYARIDSTDHIESFRRALMHTRAATDHTPNKKPTSESKSTLDFILRKVRNLSDAEKRIFLAVKQGQRLPTFVQNWRAELPYKVSDKTFANSLRAEMKRSKRKK